MSFSTESEASKQKFPYLKIVFSIFSIIMIRMFLENFAYPNPLGYFFPIERILHSVLYFFSLFLSLSIILYLFTKTSFEEILTFTSKIFLFTLSVPIVDLILNKFLPKAFMAYMIINPADFFSSFLQIINPLSQQGVTIGQHFAAWSILLSMIYFVYMKTKSTLKIVLLSISVALMLSFYEIVPSIIIFLNGFTSNTIETYHQLINQSWMSNYSESPALLNQVFFQTETAHEIIMMKLFFILLIMHLTFIIFVIKKNFWCKFKNDLRVLRIIYWFIIAAIGIIIGQKLGGDLNITNPMNVVSLIVFLITGTLCGWLAAMINDSEDIRIDEISNPERPLAAKKISLEDWNIIQIFLSLLIIAGLSTMSKPVVSLFVLNQAIYYIYSANPLRLRRHFIPSSILIGVASVSISMAGFFLVSENQKVSAFPIKAIFIIGFAYGLISNFKDIKDFAGDKFDKIKTLPVLFGQTKAKYIIAALSSIAVISVPLFLEEISMTLLAITVSIYLAYVITKKKFQEKYISLAIFVYVIGLYLLSK